METDIAPGANVFVICSYKDEHWLDGLKNLLAPCFRDGRIAWWDDASTKPGDRRDDWSGEAIGSAKVAVLLVSGSFLASEFIADRVLPAVLRASAEGRTRLLWILLDDCVHDGTGISIYRALHDVSRPLAALSEPQRRGALAKIARRIVAELALASIARGLGIVDEIANQLEAVSEHRSRERPAGCGAVALREDGRLEFRGREDVLYETVTADDLLRLDPESLELIQTLDDSIRRQFQLWKSAYADRLRPDGTIDPHVEQRLEQIARSMYRDLLSILNFLLRMGKDLQDHYKTVLSAAS